MSFKLLVCTVKYSVCRGMDPIMLAAVCGVASGIAGYMVGGAIFTATWKLIAKNQAKELEEVQKKFFFFEIGDTLWWCVER